MARYSGEPTTPTIQVPEPLARAFSERAIIGSAEVCSLLSLDPQTLRRHCKAGHIEFVQIGFGEVAPRRGFTLEAIMRFLTERSEQRYSSAHQHRARRGAATVGTEENAFAAMRERLIAERQKQKAAEQRAANGPSPGRPSC